MLQHLRNLSAFARGAAPPAGSSSTVFVTRSFAASKGGKKKKEQQIRDPVVAARLARRRQKRLDAKRQRHTRVIFIKEHGTTGLPGEIASVRAGFARNFLLPQQIAVWSRTETNKKLALKEGDELYASMQQHRTLLAFKEKLRRSKLRMVSDYDRFTRTLLEPITPEMVAEALGKQHNIDIPDDALILSDVEPNLIRLEGETIIKVMLSSEMSAATKVIVSGNKVSIWDESRLWHNRTRDGGEEEKVDVADVEFSSGDKILETLKERRIKKSDASVDEQTFE